MPNLSGKYVSPDWVNDASPALDADELNALSGGVELAEHPYGVCAAAGLTAEKAVTVDFSGTLSLFAGLCVRVKFTYGNTAAAPTLNVNGTGAKPILLGGAAAGSGAWAAGAVVPLTYDGTGWCMEGAGGPQQLSVSLPASWGGTGPYTQTVSVSGVAAGSVGFLDVAQSATAAQRAAARSALLYITAQGNGTITVTADGDMPTVAIPCVLTIVR